MAEQKALTGVEVKDATKGIVEAVFATLDVVDSDGDITLKGAFEDGAQIRVSAYGHKTWDGLLPVGRGTIRSGDKDAVAEMKFFMATDHGRNTFETVKEMADLQEWSYGYDVIEHTDPDEEQKDLGASRILQKLQVHEVSPVLLGAGVGTRTLAVKEAQEFANYLTGTTTTTTFPISTTISLDGNKVARAVAQQQRKSFPDECGRVLGDIADLVTRVEGWGQDPEQKTGRVLSAANRERLTGLMSSLGEMTGRLQELLAESDPDKDRGELERQLLRYEQLRSTL